MSLDRAWFERLSGFTEDFVFGHYEDADLCLKSIQAGTAPWLHNVKLWHLEGRGSTRLPVHDGGSLINRWLFSGMWGSYISDSLSGPEPTQSNVPHDAGADPNAGRAPRSADAHRQSSSRAIAECEADEEQRGMKVLLVSLFHPELVRGGAQQVCYELFEGLKELLGVEPTLLAAIDPSFPALYKLGAPDHRIRWPQDEYLFLRKDYDYRWHKSLSADQLEHYADFLRLIQPDVVHFHHFLLYGIEILTLTRRVLPSARIVFTLHEFLTMCAADGQMVRNTDGSLCDGPSMVKCHQCFPDRGPEDFFLRELWFKRHMEAVDIFTTPSRFMIDYFVRWGLDREKIAYVTNGQRDYNATKPLIDAPRAKHNRFGFFGQMVDNKGVLVLLKAVEILRGQGFTGFSVEINGDNLQYASAPRRDEIEAVPRGGEGAVPRATACKLQWILSRGSVA